MAKRERMGLTDEERAVTQLRCSAGWQRWLTVGARVGLRRYSLTISRPLRSRAATALRSCFDVKVPRGPPASGSLPRREPMSQRQMSRAIDRICSLKRPSRATSVSSCRSSPSNWSRRSPNR